MFKEYKYDQALACYQRGQIDQAIDLIKEVLADEPNDANSHGLLALCLLSEKRLYAAEYETQLALNINASIPMLYLILARIHILKNKPKKAIDFCNEALSLNPNYADSLLLKADIYSLLNSYNESLQCIQEAAILEPDNIEIALAFGNHYYQVGQYEKSTMYAQEAMQADPQNIECNILYGQLKLKEGDTEEALNLAKFAIIQNPNSAEALKLFCDIKTSQNLFLGLWWRFNSKMSSLSPIKASIVLISMFLVFNLLSQLLSDLGYNILSKTFSYGWLLFVIYSWLGAPMYTKKLNKELSQFKFNKDY